MKRFLEINIGWFGQHHEIAKYAYYAMALAVAAIPKIKFGNGGI